MTATSGPGKLLPARPSEEHLRKEAKRLAKAKGLPIAQAQRQLARDYGFASWTKLLGQVRRQNPPAPTLPPLIKAILAGDVAQVEQSIAAGEAVDATAEGQGSPLWHACAAEAPAAVRLAMVTRLLDAGARELLVLLPPRAT